MINKNIISINQLYIHNFHQLPSKNVLHSYQSIYYSRLNIKYSITKLFQNLLDEYESLYKIKKTTQSHEEHRIIVDILLKLYLTLKRCEKSFNSKLSTALYLLCKLTNHRNQYQYQQMYHNHVLVNLSQKNKRTHLISQLEQTMNDLKKKYNLEIIEYNKLIIVIKFYMLYFQRGIIFLDEKNMTNQEINSRSLRPKIVMFYKWIDKLRNYFVIYFEKGKQKKIKSQSFNSWKINLKLFRTISLLNFHSKINIDIDAKHVDIDYLRDQYIKIIYNIEEFYKRLLNRITLDVDENRNIYGEKYNYKNHVNKFDNGIKTEFLEKLFYSIEHLKNQLNSYKIKINYYYEKIKKLQELLTGYTNSELVDQNETLRKDLKLLIKNTKLWKLMINRIEWTIASRENMLNNTILESIMNLEKQKVDQFKKHFGHRKI